MVQKTFEDAVSSALKSGYGETDILNMVISTIDNQRAPRSVEEPTDTIYDELPEGLIDVRSAAERYGVPAANISMWVNRGRIPNCGRLKAPAAGGGIKVTSEAALVAYMETPKSKGGRPRKTS